MTSWHRLSWSRASSLLGIASRTTSEDLLKPVLQPTTLNSHCTRPQTCFQNHVGLTTIVATRHTTSQFHRGNTIHHIHHIPIHPSWHHDAHIHCVACCSYVFMFVRSIFGCKQVSLLDSALEMAPKKAPEAHRLLARLQSKIFSEGEAEGEEKGELENKGEGEEKGELENKGECEGEKHGKQAKRERDEGKGEGAGETHGRPRTKKEPEDTHSKEFKELAHRGAWDRRCRPSTPLYDSLGDTQPDSSPLDDSLGDTQPLFL